MIAELQLSDEDGERTIELLPGRSLVVGRAPDCDLVLDTRKVSRRHARLSLADGRLTVTDLDSTNGTFVDGVKVSSQELRAGAVVTVGRASLVFAGLRALPTDPAIAPAVGSSPQGGEEAASTIVDRSGDPASGPGDGEPAPGSAGARSAVTTPATGPTAGRFRRSSRVSRPLRIAQVAFGIALISSVAVLALLNRQSLLEVVGARRPGPDEGREWPRVSRPPEDMLPGETAAVEPDSIATGLETRVTGRAEATGDSPQATPVGRPEQATAPLSPDSSISGPSTRLARLLDENLEGELGWAIIEDLRALAEEFPGTREGRYASDQAAILTGVRRGVEAEHRRLLDTSIDDLVANGRLGQARAVLRFLTEIAREPAAAEQWRERAREIEARARRQVDELEKRLDGLLEAGRHEVAFEALLDAREIHGGTAAYEAVFAERAVAGLRTATRPEPNDVLNSPEAIRLKNEATLAFEACRFEELTPTYYALLGLGPPAAERLDFVDWLLKSYYMRRMFQEVLGRLNDKPVGPSPVEGYEGRILSASPEAVEFELDMEGRRAAYTGSLSWDRIPHLTKFRIFESQPLGDEATLAVALYAFEIGHEEGAHRLLIRLRKRKDARELADAVFSWHAGIPVPPGGFVEYRERLVTPEVRDAEIARLEHIRAEEEAAREELRRLEKDSRLAAFVAFARRHRAAGHFQLAHSILTTLARRFPREDQGIVARRLLEDPVLHVEELRIAGRSENRLDFCFLGEGFPIKDDEQGGFLNRARAALDLLLKEEPFREYASYLNFHAVYLGSKDRGVDRFPGNVTRETALDGRIEYDRFTVSNSRVQEILRRVGPGGADRQGLVIGNDYAGVSTGGGGVSSVTKVAITSLAHEIGHSLAGLADEYEYEPGTDPNRRVDRERQENVPTRAVPPNLMAGSDRDDVIEKALWRDWIEAGEPRWWNHLEVGAFEGANRSRFNYWRPQVICKMRSSGVRFCVVCMETMVLRIHDFVRPIDRVDPEDSSITVAHDGEALVKVWPMTPATHDLETRWSLVRLPERAAGDRTTVVRREPEPVDFRSHQRRRSPGGVIVDLALVRGQELGPGAYRLSVTVRDRTPWVLRDPDGRLEEEREWTLRILSPPPPGAPEVEGGRDDDGHGQER